MQISAECIKYVQVTIGNNSNKYKDIQRLAKNY